MSRTVRRITVVQNSKLVSGSALTVLGLASIIVALSNAWASGVSFLDLSVLNRFLWTNRLDIGFGIELEFIYLIIAGAVTMVLGLFLLTRRTQRVEEVTIVKDDVAVTLECTYCGYRWKEFFSKTQLESMGFPRNRTISRRRCEVCGRFTRPKIVGI